jgi:hypothetical protein
MINQCGSVGGIRIGKGNGSNKRNPIPMTFYPQIPNDLTWYQSKVTSWEAGN